MSGSCTLISCTRSGCPPNGHCRLWLLQEARVINGHDADRPVVVTAITSPTEGLHAPGQTLAISCIDEFELTASVAAAIYLHQGTLTLIQLHLHFETCFFFRIPNFNVLHVFEALPCSLSDLGSTN